MCGKVYNPDLFHILSERKHGGNATLLDRHNRVACAVRKAIEIGNPHAKIAEDKTVLEFCPELTEGRRLRPDLTFESAEVVRGKSQNTFHFVEIAVPWSYEGQNGSALISAYRKKVGKYQEVLAELERKRPDYKATQTTIIVSPTGAFLRESQEELAKVSKLPRAKLAVHSRCIVDAAIQGAYEQWHEFGKRMAHAKEIRSIHPEEAQFVRIEDEDDLAKMGAEILDECPELDVEIDVADPYRGIIIPDVGQPSPIEIYEASILEQRVAEFTGLPSRPIEKHPDGHKGDGNDGRDADFGRSMQERDHFDSEKLREESEERQRQLAYEAPPIYLSGIPKPVDSTHFEVSVGFRGNWTQFPVSQDISEEDFTQMVIGHFNEGVATPDFKGRPHRGQEFRFIRDLSEGDEFPIWITLRCRELSSTLTIRVSLRTSQEQIERAAMEEMDRIVIFANKFPSVIESNAVYQLKVISEDSEAQPIPDSDVEEISSLKSIPSRCSTPIPPPPMFTRSGSADDLRGVGLAADVVPKTDYIARWVLKFGNKVTQITAPENAEVQEVCDRAAIQLGIGLKKWKTTIDRKGSRIFVTCILPELIFQEASIHFGNIEWAGKVNRTYEDDRILREAQTQLGIEGTWNVRHVVIDQDVRKIEAERIEVVIDRPDLPKDSEVTFDFNGTRKTVTLKSGATAFDQAQAAQKAFGVTLECGPIEQDGDQYTVHVYKPSVFPIMFVRNGERTRSWVNNTKTKTVQEEAQRLFGGKPSVELLNEPGLVYEVKSAPQRVKTSKKKPESNTRQMTGPGIKAVVPPSMVTRRATPRPAISQRSSDGRDLPATGPDRAVGPRGVDIHVIFPQKTQTIKNVALSRTATKEEIANLI
jgi:hypothetical protein